MSNTQRFDIAYPAVILPFMRTLSSRMLGICLVSVVIGFSFVFGVSADPPPTPDADPPTQAEQDPQTPEDACTDIRDKAKRWTAGVSRQSPERRLRDRRDRYGTPPERDMARRNVPERPDNALPEVVCGGIR